MMRTTLLASAAILGLAMGAPAFAQTGVPTATTPLVTTPGQPNGQNSGMAKPAPGMTTPSVGNTQNGGHAMATPGATGTDAATAPSGSVGMGSAGMPEHSTMDHSAMTGTGMGTKPMRRHRMTSATGGQNDVGTGTSEPTSGRASNIDRADTRSDIAPRLPMPNVGPNADAAQYVAAARMALQRGQTGMAQEALERAETRMLDRSTAPSAANTPDSGPMIKQITDARQALAHGDRAAAQQILGQGGDTAASQGTMGGAGMKGGMAKDAPVKGQSM